MATTTNYAWEEPTVLGDSGSWGTKLNTTLQDIDTDLKTVSDVADAALPKAGGAMTGRVDGKTATSARVDKGSISGAQSLDLSAAQYFTLTPSSATTLSFTNVPAGAWATAMMLRITNGASRITWPASVKWPSGSPPVLTTAGVDLVGLVTDDNGVTWRGFVVARDLR